MQVVYMSAPSDKAIWRMIERRLKECGIAESAHINAAMHALAEDVLESMRLAVGVVDREQLS
jgi:hypothetical protein